MRAVLVVTALLFVAGPCSAQALRDGKLLVTVVDQSGGVLPGAMVTVTGLEDATKARTFPAAKSHSAIGLNSHKPRRRAEGSPPYRNSR